MSRNILVPVKATDDLSRMRDTESGKLLFTTYKNRTFAFLLRANRLLAAQMLPKESPVGAIYIGKVRRAVPNINAYFVEIANGEICFLPGKETHAGHPLKEGDELPVQITREAQKTKQASVTAHLSLSNAYAALQIGTAKIGFSGKLSAARREEIRAWLREAGMVDSQGNFCAMAAQETAPAKEGTQTDLPVLGAVIRTQAGECSKEELLRSLQSLTKAFTDLLQGAQYRTCFSCIRRAPAGYETVFDQMVYPYEYDEIVTDQRELFDALEPFCEQNLPGKKLRLYADPQFPLSKLYSLDTKMETALERRVWLKSGGYLVIDPTEALTVIDVNSGKYDAKKPSAETAWLINREAAEEISLQLRLRNLSGIILVDFINLEERGRQEELLHLLRERTKRDKLKTSVHDMTALGLVEITRKKQHKTLREQVRDQKG